MRLIKILMLTLLFLLAISVCENHRELAASSTASVSSVHL